MSEKYRYDHRSPKHKKKHVYNVAIVSAVIIGLIVIIILVLFRQTLGSQHGVAGPSQTVGHVSASGTVQTTNVVEPYFTMQIPTNWRQTAEVNTPSQYSITWTSFKSGVYGRFLTIYIDTIPTTMAVNKLLPVTSNGPGLSYGTLSDNCTDFSNGTPQQVSPAKWDGVDFLCNWPNRYDNQVGTGTVGAINSVSMTGAKTGTHQYFFLYTDRSAEPDYSILYAILNSFQAT